MSQIALIAPNREIETSALEAKARFNLEIDIYVGMMDAGVKIARDLAKKGTKVFISRGGTALAIKKKLNPNVVEIKMALDDAARAIAEAKAYGNKFLLIGFSNHLQGFETLGPILDLTIQQAVINDWHEARETIIKAKEDAFDAIIGGAVQCSIARELHIRAVFLKSSPIAIHNAYREATAILDVLLAEERKTEEMRTVLNYSSDGFVAIDKHARITLMNAAASQFLNCDPQGAAGCKLQSATPKISSLVAALQSPVKLADDIITLGKNTVLYSRIPLLDDDQIIGAMATLKDINRVHEEDRKIRYQQYTRGLYAKYHFSDILGDSQNLIQAKQIAARFSKTDSTILITSESGTGKEMFAQSIHNASPRAEGPFVAINCASLADSILESELFGYVEGAFTDAKKSGKAGVFEMARGGTLFLDEIGEVAITLQGKLLRALQERTVMRLGDDKVIPVDARIIAATNRNLVEGIKQGNFREDLFFRLNILRLTIPPLRQRKEDIPILVKAFLTKYPPGKDLQIDSRTLTALQQYYWPGNIRELENLIERLSIISPDQAAMTACIADHFRELEALIDVRETETLLNPDEVQRVLAAVDGNKTKAAEILGIHRSTLWRFLKNNRH